MRPGMRPKRWPVTAPETIAGSSSGRRRTGMPMSRSRTEAWKYGWEVGVRFRLASGSPSTFFNGGIFDSDADAYIGLPGPVNEERLPLFHQLDIRVDKKFVFKKWILTVYLDIQNVYNFRAKEFVRYNFNFTQRNYVMGLPIIPSIGIKGSF